MVMVSSAVALSPAQGSADGNGDTLMGLAFLYACSEGEEGADEFRDWGLNACKVEVCDPETRACDGIPPLLELPCHETTSAAYTVPICSSKHISGTVGAELTLPLGWTVDGEIKGSMTIVAQLRNSTRCNLAQKLGAVGPAVTIVKHKSVIVARAQFDVEVSGTLVGPFDITVGEQCDHQYRASVCRPKDVNACNTSMGGDF